MAQNQTGIAIVIKAWLPAGKSLDEQFEALSIVKTAHATGDYAPLLAAASVEEVKTEQKTRRIEIAPTTEEPADAVAQEPVAQEADPVEHADRGEFVSGRKGRAVADPVTEAEAVSA